MNLYTFSSVALIYKLRYSVVGWLLINFTGVHIMGQIFDATVYDTVQKMPINFMRTAILSVMRCTQVIIC